MNKREDKEDSGSMTRDVREILENANAMFSNHHVTPKIKTDYPNLITRQSVVFHDEDYTMPLVNNYKFVSFFMCRRSDQYHHSKVDKTKVYFSLCSFYELSINVYTECQLMSTTLQKYIKKNVVKKMVLNKINHKLLMFGGVLKDINELFFLNLYILNLLYSVSDDEGRRVQIVKFITRTGVSLINYVNKLYKSLDVVSVIHILEYFNYVVAFRYKYSAEQYREIKEKLFGDDFFRAVVRRYMKKGNDRRVILRMYGLLLNVLDLDHTLFLGFLIDNYGYIDYLDVLRIAIKMMNCKIKVDRVITLTHNVENIQICFMGIYMIINLLKSHRRKIVHTKMFRIELKKLNVKNLLKNINIILDYEKEITKFAKKADVQGRESQKVSDILDFVRFIFLYKMIDYNLKNDKDIFDEMVDITLKIYHRFETYKKNIKIQKREKKRTTDDDDEEYDDEDDDPSRIEELGKLFNLSVIYSVNFICLLISLQNDPDLFEVLLKNKKFNKVYQKIINGFINSSLKDEVYQDLIVLANFCCLIFYRFERYTEKRQFKIFECLVLILRKLLKLNLLETSRRDSRDEFLFNYFLTFSRSINKDIFEFLKKRFDNDFKDIFMFFENNIFRQDISDNIKRCFVLTFMKMNVLLTDEHKNENENYFQSMEKLKLYPNLKKYINQKIPDAGIAIDNQIGIMRSKVVNATPFCSCCKVKDTEKKLLRCSKCQLVYYCSRECQVKDWINHKNVCN